MGVCLAWLESLEGLDALIINTLIKALGFPD